MTLYFDETEVSIKGEPFYLDIEVEITSFPVKGRSWGAWEDCYPDEGGEYEVKGTLSKELHPFLVTLKIPELEAEIENALDEWSKKNEDKIWRKAEEQAQEV